MADVSIDIELITKAFDQALKQSGDKVKGFQATVERTQKGVSVSFKKIEDEAKKTAKGFTVLRGAAANFLGELAADAVRQFTRSLGDLAIGIVDGARRFEQLNVRFEVLTGSAETAGAVLRDITEFAATTPFELEGISNAAAQLLSFGTSVGDVRGQLESIGNVAAAVNQPIERLSFIFGQIQAQGRLTAERLNQLQEASIPIGPALAKTLGIAESQLRDFVSNTGVSFEQFQQAFNSLSQEGGPAFNALIKQSTTLEGLISNLKDTFTLLQVEIGNQLLPTLKEFLGAVLTGIQQNKDFIVSLGTGAIKVFAQTLALGVNAFNVLLAIVDAAVIGFDSFKFVIESTNEEILSLQQSAFELAALLQRLATGEVSEGLQADIDRINGLREASASASTEIAQNIDLRIKKRKEEGQALQQLATNLRNSVNATRDAEQDKLDLQSAAAAERQRKAEEAELAQQNAIALIRQDFAAQQKEAALEGQIAQAEADGGNIERIRELELQKIEVIREAEIQKAQLLGDSLQKAQAIETANQKAKISQIKVNNKAELALEEDKIFRVQKFEDLSNKQRIQNLKGTLGTIATLQSSSSKTLFGIGKAAAIGTATIDGIAAVQKALASAPPPFNFVLAGLVGAATAANIANIASQQPPSAGSFQNGGIVGGSSFSGDNLTANVNSGELILNRGQQQQLFNIANGRSQGTADTPLTAETVRDIVETTVREMQVVLVADDVEIARSTARGVDNGIIIAGT